MKRVAPVIVWFRRDLRISDNPALTAGVQSGAPVIPVYIHDSGDETGRASQWWLHHALAALASSLRAIGAPLILRRGNAARVLHDFVRETGAEAVFWNRQYDARAIARDTAIKTGLGVRTQSFNASLLREPWELKPASGPSYKVFTPFYRALLSSGPIDGPLAAPPVIDGCHAPLESDALEQWSLTPTRPNWAAAFLDHWTPGEAAAQARLNDFLDGPLSTYSSERDRPDLTATSRLSPHLHFGSVSPRQIWTAAQGSDSAGAEKFQSELAWREFSYHLLYHFPDLPHRNLRTEFDAFPWRNDSAAFAAWSRGRTGIPIVDAGMRELWTTGWMHNRVRMIAASFLIKNLLIDWRRGERWFHDTLVDADPASNAASWQWVAGSGADAAPYFRIFNPVLQGRKFDPKGDYVRRWITELSGLPAEFVHAPWEAAASTLAAASVKLGMTYPAPIVDIPASRLRALDAFASLKRAA